MPEPPPMLRPGQSPTAKDWNALVARLAEVSHALDAAPGVAGTGISVTGGGLRSFQVRDLRQTWHWAKIGAGTGANYAHTQAVANSTGFEDLAASSESIWGTATHIPARERNGNTTVPAGAYVRLYPNGSDDDPGFVFEYVPGDIAASSCTHCEWLAGMGLTRCLRVSVAGTLTDLYLSTTDGRVFTSGDLLTICGTDYTVIVAGVSGGMPQIQLTPTGSGAVSLWGMLKCCGCAYATWGFNLQAVCPDEPDTGSSCTNTLEVRVDEVDCAGGPSCGAATVVALGEPMQNRSIATPGEYEIGFLSWSITVTAGTTYRVRFRRHGPSGGGIAVISGVVYNPSCAVQTTNEPEFDSGATLLDTDTDYCWDFTPTINGCLCITMGNNNFLNQNTATITVGSCP